MSAQQLQARIDALRRKAETGEQWAEICALEDQRLAAVAAEQYAASIAQQTKEFNKGRARGLREGSSFDAGEQDFAFKSVAYEDGYYNGFRQGRENLLAGRSYEEVPS